MHPILIAGAVLAGVPVLLHLIMRQEPKRLPFPAIRFLQQRRRTNQRKLRLRHLLLLALRMLLILLFALALFQPTLSGGNLVLSEEQPIEAVFVLDTTPSMGYLVGERSRLDDARKRALELLEDLPSGSRVAVIDPDEPTVADWEPSIGEARRRVEAMAVRLGGSPVTSGLVAAYQLLRRSAEGVDADPEVPLPRLVAVFSDRAAASWDAGRIDDLTRLRDAIPEPPPAHLFADVGVGKPTNVAILAAEVRPESLPSNQPVTIAVAVQATGADVKSCVVRCRLDGGGIERRELALRAGTPQAVSFTFRDLTPGFHQAEVSLETADALMADNVRFVTFRVGQPRKVLTITDDPTDAALWALAIDQKGDFACEARTPADAPDFAGFEAVCLFGVADPNRPLTDGKTVWDRLADYLKRGGRVAIVPGTNPADGAYDPALGAAGQVLPGKLARVREAPADRPGGAAWLLNDAALRHPLIAPFREWRKLNVDFLRNPRLAWKYWEVQAPPEHVVVSYDDADDPARRSPAVLERTFPNGGKVLLLTVPLNPQWDYEQRWHNYLEIAESSWPVVLPNLLLTYLAGDSSEVRFNFTTGQSVTLPLPPPVGGKPPRVRLEGPGVSEAEATPTIGDGQVRLELPAFRTLSAGNFALRSEDDKTWREAFSLNPPAEESDLDKVPAEAIEAVCGPGSIVPADKALAFRAKIDRKFNRPFELFPWLLLAALLLFAAECWVSNRFYRLRA